MQLETREFTWILSHGLYELTVTCNMKECNMEVAGSNPTNPNDRLLGAILCDLSFVSPNMNLVPTFPFTA